MCYFVKIAWKRLEKSSSTATGALGRLIQKMISAVLFSHHVFERLDDCLLQSHADYFMVVWFLTPRWIRDDNRTHVELKIFFCVRFISTRYYSRFHLS